MREAQQIYPAAAPSYLAIYNLVQEKENFINGRIDFPKFQYDSLFSKSILDARSAHLTALIKDVSSERETKALQKLCVQTNFLLSAVALQQSDAGADQLTEFRQLGASLYGSPRRDMAALVLKSIQSYADGGKKCRELWNYIESNISMPVEPPISKLPSRGIFLYYQAMLKKYAPLLFQPAEKWPPDIENATLLALQEIGADKLGWNVEQKPTGTHAHVSYRNKCISIGKHYSAHSFTGMKSVVAHEVYGHVNRNLLASTNVSTRESEGIAILVEQLLASDFSLKRAYRYLAAAAGWGVLGDPMNFREAYEIVWRAMVIRSRYDEATAKSKAFNECVRVFRGGRPDLAGGVYTKDVVYLEGNLQVWEILINNKLGYDEFADLLKGKTRMEIA